MEAVDNSVSAGQVGSSGKIDTSSGYNSRRDWLIGVGVSALLTLIFGLVNWHWLQVNVVTYGWDRMDHLITTLVFNNMLAAPGPTTLYDLLAYASYYPPLVHYTAAAAYQIFGVSEEIAVMANLLYLFVLLLATGAIARRLEGTANARNNRRDRDVDPRYFPHDLRHVALSLPRFCSDCAGGGLASPFYSPVNV